MAITHLTKRFFVKLISIFAFSLLLSGCIDTGLTSQGPNVNTGKPVVVALLVPSESGNAQQDALADSLVRAAKLAISQMPEAKIDLRVYATAGNADKATQAAQQALSDGAKIFIGPLFAEAANAAGKVAARKGINVLSFSNNPNIAGGNVFILGDTFQNAANRIIGYSVANGRRNIGAIARSDAAGDVAIQAIESASQRNGAKYVGVARYEMNTESVITSIKGAKQLINTAGANALVLDADSAGALPVYAQLLPENGITAQSVQILGLTRWDRSSAQVQTTPGLQGSVFAMPDTTATAVFTQSYTAANGSSPHLLAGKSYDAMRAVGTLLSSGARDALTRNKLIRSAGFAGANGVFRLLPDGTNQRALAIAELREGKVVIVSPGPRGFSGSGS